MTPTPQRPSAGASDTALLTVLGKGQRQYEDSFANDGDIHAQQRPGYDEHRIGNLYEPGEHHRRRLNFAGRSRQGNPALTSTVIPARDFDSAPGLYPFTPPAPEAAISAISLFNSPGRFRLAGDFPGDS